MLPWTILRYVGYVYVWFTWHDILVGSRRSNMTRKMVDYSSLDSPYRSDKKHGDWYSLDTTDTWDLWKKK